MQKNHYDVEARSVLAYLEKLKWRSVFAYEDHCAAVIQKSDMNYIRNITFMHTYIHTYIHYTTLTYIQCVRAYTCIHTYIHTYIHKRTYIHTYIHTVYLPFYCTQGFLKEKYKYISQDFYVRMYVLYTDYPICSSYCTIFYVYM